MYDRSWTLTKAHCLLIQVLKEILNTFIHQWHIRLFGLSDIMSPWTVTHSLWPVACVLLSVEQCLQCGLFRCGVVELHSIHQRRFEFVQFKRRIVVVNASREQISPESRCTGFFLALPSPWVGTSSFHAAQRFAFVLLGESTVTKDESRCITRTSGEQFVITDGTGGQPEWFAGCLDILICYVSRKGELIL